MSAASAAAPGVRSNRRETIAIPVARGAVAVALCGTGFSPPVTNVALVIALIALLCAPSAHERLREVLRLPVARAALALFALIALGMLWSAAPWAERIHHLSAWRPLVLILIALAVFSTPKSKSRLAVVLVAFAVVGALLSFESWFTQRPLLSGHLPGTVLRNSSTQSMVLLVGLTMAVVLGFWRGPGVQFASRLRWLFVAAAVLLFANLLFVTTGRSGQMALAIIAATLALWLIKGRLRWALLIGVPVLTAAVIATSPVVQTRFSTGWQEMQSVETAPELTSMGMRVVMWRTSVEVIKDRPWFGYGTGGFAPAYEKKTVLMNQGWRAVPTADPHNQYLFALAERGIVGLLALLAFIAVAAWQSASRPWKQVALGFLLAWSATSVFSSHFQTFNEGHLLLLLLGVLLAPQRDYPSVAKTVDSTSS